MRSNRLGCLTGTGIITALIVAFAIVGSALAGGGLMYSPGELNAVTGEMLGGVSSHAEIAGDCKACHVAPWEAQTMDDRCSTCHLNVAVEMRDPTSIHGRMMEIDPQAKCRTCHPEHNGPTAMLTVLEGWRFPHEVAHYSLNGHQFTEENEPFLCADCHGNDVTTFDVVACQQCHLDNDMAFMVDHKVAFGDSCLECHDGVDRFGDDFDHDQFAFKLEGKHAVVVCSQCHFQSHTLASLQATGQDCFACHQDDDPHQETLGPDCASCHSPADWKPSTFDHNRSVFKLDGSHVDVACESCHVNGVFKGTPQDCFSCHQDNDPHNGQLGTACEQCHTTGDWANAVFDHSKTAFPLIGQHADAECALCHKNGQYKGTPTDCASCHVDVHMGQFGRDCATCHSPAAWVPVQFDHNSTGFRLTGSHSTAECKACHVNGVFKGTPNDCFSCHAAADAHNGQFGTACGTCHKTTKWQDVFFDHKTTSFPLTGSHVIVACKACHVNNVFKGTPTTCFACHAADDKHNGQFGTDCAKCHKTSAWRNVFFDHSQTAFPLTGKHTPLACSKCHANSVFANTPKECVACHAAVDVHRGQFGTNCSQCHTPSGWNQVVFDHSRTAFALTGSHVNVTCNKCHVNGVYQGTPKDCFSCHASRDVHAGQFGTNCAQCHKTTQWIDVIFDHSSTAFPLNGTHTSVTCRACHTNGIYRGTPKECVACHAARDAHAGQFGTNCGQCHRPTTWPDATFDHNNTAFPLVSSHRTVACTACHRNGVYRGTPKDCFSCHADRDPHNGQFGTACGSCHEPTDWSDATFDHNQTSFPLAGRHTNLACTSCHSNGVYRGTPQNCYACHSGDDHHNGQMGQDCAQCHSPSGWGNVNFNHNNTAFPLTGRHTRVACSQCHQGGRYSGTPTDCAACHSEPNFHAGAFGANCAQCHATSAWTPAPFVGTHPRYDGENMLNHHGATCKTCHNPTVNQFTCLECHDSNNP
ncbi:MAG: hypothetical protein AB1649_05775 [Chloroflexota bacterium]